MNYLPRPYYWLLCLAIIAGCQSTKESEPAASTAVETRAPNAAAPVKANPAAPHAPELANAKVTSAQVAEFKPPFKERELFAPPKQARGTVRRDDEHGQSVELKGFINVDQPRVVLSIDNVIAVIPEGGEKYGVQVISIQPPNAVLQRGRNRWPVTLE